MDEFSLSVRLGQRFYRPQRVEVPIAYGRVASVEAHYESVCAAEMTLAPQEAVLASSRDPYAMPLGYLGLLHTKGTLARLFVCVQCADPQVEPGFKGQLTMELVNHAPFPVTLCAGAIVGQLERQMLNNNYPALCRSISERGRSHSSYSGIAKRAEPPDGCSAQ